MDSSTNYVWSVRCVVHTLALCINDVFLEGNVWQTHMDLVNGETSCYNQHPKVSQMFVRMQLETEIANDCLQRLRYDIPTRWHARFRGMLMYLNQFSLNA